MWRPSPRFELLELLGEGGQGSVYKALRRDRRAGLEQIVALKILHSKTAVELWRQEFESLARVRSKFCVRVLSFERHFRRPTLVLEYIDGVSLARLSQSGFLPAEAIAEINAQLEHALKELHAHGVFHGDLSPQNILIDREGGVRLLDFGLANCAPGQVRATPDFAAPERLAGRPVDENADLFSLGRVLEFLAGRPLDLPCYLQREPARRHWRELAPTLAGQGRLALKVNEFLARQNFRQGLTTRTHAPNARPARRPRAFLLGAITSLMLLATSSATQILKPAQLAVLSVRTEKWHYFVLNGKPLGYSPFSLPLRAGARYRLEWLSAKGRGVKELVLEAREGRRFEDRDFSH